MQGARERLYNEDMKVKVYAPGFIIHGQTDEQGCILLPDGTTLEGLFKVLQIPESFRYSLTCSINNRHIEWETQLHENDQIMMMLPLAGG